MVSIEELKRRLYRKEESFKERTHSPNISQADFSKKEPEIKGGLGFGAKTNLNLNKIMGSKIFWAVTSISIVILLFVFFSNIFNFQNVGLKIEGPTEIKSGERVYWKVVATNRNKKDINEASLVFNIKDVKRERVFVGKIKSGESVEREFEAVVFGGRGKNFESRALIEYKPEGSSIFLAEEEIFSFIVAQSPVTISFSIPENVRIGDDLSFDVHYFSQSDIKLENLFLKVDYPTSFGYKNATPKAQEKNNIWIIGDLDPGEEGSIRISGFLKEGSSGVANFSASLGTRSGDDFLSLDEALGSIVLSSPYLGVDILPKGEKRDFTASIGEEIPFLIEWKNNLPEVLENASLEVFISGDAMDLSSVRVRDGSFVSRDKKIVWNTSSFKGFKSVSPGESDFLGFSLRIKKDISLNNVGKNPKINVKAIFKPGKTVPGFESTNVLGEDEVEIPISSVLQFSQQGFYFDSPFLNTGPLPPKAGQKTTYTISWSLANPINDVKNLVVRATLPPYVNFENVFSPSSANVVFNKDTGVVEWRIGVLEAGTGFIKSALSTSFQISVIPSENHIGDSPQIISEAEVSGTDSFTEKILSTTQREITTDLRDDLKLDFSQKKVVE